MSADEPLLLQYISSSRSGGHCCTFDLLFPRSDHQSFFCCVTTVGCVLAVFIHYNLFLAFARVRFWMIKGQPSSEPATCGMSKWPTKTKLFYTTNQIWKVFQHVFCLVPEGWDECGGSVGFSVTFVLLLDLWAVGDHSPDLPWLIRDCIKKAAYSLTCQEWFPYCVQIIPTCRNIYYLCCCCVKFHIAFYSFSYIFCLFSFCLSCEIKYIALTGPLS